jgi:hypothetical protein
MTPFALVALLSLAPAPARADDAPNPADASAPAADDLKSNWGAAGVQEAAVRGAATAPADATPSASPGAQAAPEQVLSAWAHDCPAIADFLASKGAPSPKRGVGVSYDVGNAGEIVGRLGPHWYYTWGTKPVADTNAEFTPMIRDVGNGASDAANNLREVGQLRPSPPFVLAYDEPDVAGVSPEDKTWAKSYAPGLPSGAVPVSPASSSVNDWFNQFVKSDGAQKFPVVAIHLYEDIQGNDPDAVDHAVADFERRMALVEATQKPVWVTEFGLDTPNATKEDPAKFTDEQAACFMAQVIPYLEKHAMRYAWFSPVPDSQTPRYETLPDALWNRDGGLTPLGELYSQEQ